MSTGSAVLLRAQRGGCDETGHAVHVAPLPIGLEHASTAVVGTLCGALCPLDQVETVASGVGMPCSRCTQEPDDAPCSTAYQEWGWPVAAAGDGLLLILGASVTALALSRQLVDEIAPILTSRDRQPAVLAHPAAPEHPIVLVGEPFGVPLPWPAAVRSVCGAVPLPPTVTAFGPVHWVQPPHGCGLANCREIDVFGAVRTTLFHGAGVNEGGS